MASLVGRVSTKPLLAVVLGGLLLLLSGNWLLPLMDRDEPRFAEASREMLQRGELVVPWFNNQYRFDKPPLIYWCQIACYKVLGESAFAARIPSALFAVATAAVLLLWGKRLGNEKAGFYAALMLLTCVQFLIHGRLAVADMPMIFFCTTAFWSGWEMTRVAPEPAVGWWWLFYVSLGLGFLAKGPVAWLPLGGLWLGRWFFPRHFLLGGWKMLAGVLLSLGLVGLWGIPALISTHGRFLSVGIGHHVIFRSFGIMEGHGGPGWIGFLVTLPLYLATFFFSFFPWALKVPGALRHWWSSRREDTFGAYLLLQAALVFAVFTLVRTKLPHYTLPAFPAICLWLGVRLASNQGSETWINKMALVMCALALVITLGIFQVASPDFVAANLWRRVQPLSSQDTEIAAVAFDEPSVVWEFRKGITNYVQHITLDEAAQYLQKPGDRILILPTREFTGPIKLLATNVFTFETTGIDTARFRRVQLTAIVRTGTNSTPMRH